MTILYEFFLITFGLEKLNVKTNFIIFESLNFHLITKENLCRIIIYKKLYKEKHF